MAGTGENVLVAVRVRPFNDREKDRNAQLVIDMPDGKATSIKDPNNLTNEPKWFTFDYSYWSHDGFKINSSGYASPANSKYADQKRVFNDLGKGVLDNAWNGYNCSLFAYGQTGSGKSYSIVGTKKNKGIIPLVCEELYLRIENSKNENGTEYQVTISMLEIYCERVRDLLSNKPPPKGGLKVRENPKTGFYVEELTTVPVNSYKEIEKKVNDGTRNRTIAATNMNATSSRAHTIVKIQFVQKIPKANGGTTTKSSEINLVDLAGSERQKDAGSEGDRLKEGIVINKSLSTLGRVIKALHDKQSSKKKTNIQVPYRDSVLTSLLKNALGGNSKTIMIAAISPADINYEESLSTLRFADRVKSIRTKAVINESATERMIRELKEENNRLQELMRRGGNGVSNTEEMDNLRRQLEENQREMERLEKTWQQRLAEEQKKRGSLVDDKAEIDRKRKDTPYLWNLNEDPALTDMIVHFIEPGDNIVGNGTVMQPQILLKGMSIQPEHAIIKNADNKTITLIPVSGSDILINGQQMTEPKELGQNDRILFGSNHLYVFANPKKKGVKTSEDLTYDMAQREIAKTVGIAGVGTGKRLPAELILEEDLIKLLPNVQRANSMAKELKKPVKFEILLMAPEIRGLSEGMTEILVKVYNTADDTTFYWDKNRFMNRYYGMQEMYQNYCDGELMSGVSKERDPFYEAPNSAINVGNCTMYLRSLAYMIETEEQISIMDMHGNDIGQLQVSLVPCSPAGKEVLGEYVEKPDDQVGKNLGIKVKIVAGMGLPRRIEKSWCVYKFFDQKEVTTSKHNGSNPIYSHEQVFTYRPVTKELLNYLLNGYLNIGVWATQKARESRSSSARAQSAISRQSIRSAARVHEEKPAEIVSSPEMVRKISKKKKQKSSESENQEKPATKPRKKGTLPKKRSTSSHQNTARSKRENSKD